MSTIPYDSYIVVSGNYGHLKVDRQTGAILEYVPNGDGDDEYACYTRVDIEEFQRYYGELYSGDILDFGLWCTDGSYTPPEPSYRLRPRFVPPINPYELFPPDRPRRLSCKST